MERLEIANPKFTLRKENILPQDRLPVHELLSKRLASLGWPLELQGTGKTDYQNHELKIYYPLGDVFLSFATTIHEIGHWRQNEIDKNLGKRSEFIPDDKIENIAINEEEAYYRGWKRIKKYTPELLVELETKFQKYKKTGVLKGLNNFEQLYEYFKNLSLNVSKIIESVEETDKEDEYDKRKYEALQRAGMEEKFSKLILLKVGETLNKEQMESILIKVAENVANE